MRHYVLFISFTGEVIVNLEMERNVLFFVVVVFFWTKMKNIGVQNSNKLLWGFLF